MDEEVIITLKLRVKKSSADEVKGQLDDWITDFLDESVAKQEGEIEETPA
jgi:hypothetical protein